MYDVLLVVCPNLFDKTGWNIFNATINMVLRCEGLALALFVNMQPGLAAHWRAFMWQLCCCACTRCRRRRITGSGPGSELLLDSGDLPEGGSMVGIALAPGGASGSATGSAFLI